MIWGYWRRLDWRFKWFGSDGVGLASDKKGTERERKRQRERDGGIEREGGRERDIMDI